jgi:hypothetical protein
MGSDQGGKYPVASTLLIVDRIFEKGTYLLHLSRKALRAGWITRVFPLSPEKEICAFYKHPINKILATGYWRMPAGHSVYPPAYRSSG